MHITNATGLSHSLTQLTSPQHSTQQGQACFFTTPLPANNPSPCHKKHTTLLCPGNATQTQPGGLLLHTRSSKHLSSKQLGLAHPCAATHEATYREHTSTASQPSLRTQPTVANTANSHNCTEDIVVVHDYVAKARANTQAPSRRRMTRDIDASPAPNQPTGRRLAAYTARQVKLLGKAQQPHHTTSMYQHK
jgi:hypothetical protein